jgi:hypothetical protein
VIAIEVKLRDYKRAHRQARKHILFANEVYIAMPENKAKRLDWGKIDNIGIGLISVAEKVTIMHHSNPKVKPVRQYTNRVLSHCRHSEEVVNNEP